MTDYQELNNKFDYIEEVNKKNNPQKDKNSFSLRNQIIVFVSGFSYAGLLILSFIAAFIALTFARDDKDLLSMATNAISYLILFVILLVFCFIEKDVFFAKLGKWKNYLIGLGLGILLIIVEIVLNIIIGMFYQGEQNGNQAIVETLFKSYPTLSFIIMCVIGPFCEEITYRVGLFDLLKRKNKVLAYVVEVLVFAFIHIQFTDTTLAAELASFPVYLAIGYFLTLAYDKFDLPASYMAHLFLNTISFIAVLYV